MSYEFQSAKTHQIIDINANTVGYSNKRLRTIILRDFDKERVRLGKPGRIVEIDESLFV